MNDRELLELAAKAAGYEVRFARVVDFDMTSRAEFSLDDGGRSRSWNPLTDDGDALRLAVKLELDLCISPIEHVAVWCLPLHDFVEEKRVPDAFVATRRAIVRAAAEIGKAVAPAVREQEG